MGVALFASLLTAARGSGKLAPFLRDLQASSFLWDSLEYRAFLPFVKPLRETLSRNFAEAYGEPPLLNRHGGCWSDYSYSKALIEKTREIYSLGADEKSYHTEIRSRSIRK